MKKLLALMIILPFGLSAMVDEQSPLNQWYRELKTIKEKCLQLTATHQEAEEFFSKEILDLKEQMHMK